ncbi:MAG: SCO family protein [Methylococcaceae bacterium]|nr:SCO family protein [Methylococcaceae bacterium]
MNKRNFIKNLTTGSLGMAALAALPASAKSKQVKPGKATPVSRSKALFPNVPLITHEGKIVKFYDDLIKNKTVMINFMYAGCMDICPGMTANLKKVHKEFGDRVGRDIFMYSITLEPEHDTQQVLQSYAHVFKTGPGWTFLTGTKSDIEALRRSLGFALSDPKLDKDKTQHTGVVKYGIENLERWGTCPALGDPKYIAQYLYWMEPNGLRPNLTEMAG